MKCAFCKSCLKIYRYDGTYTIEPTPENGFKEYEMPIVRLVWYCNLCGRVYNVRKEEDKQIGDKVREILKLRRIE